MELTLDAGCPLAIVVELFREYATSLPFDLAFQGFEVEAGGEPLDNRERKVPRVASDTCEGKRDKHDAGHQPDHQHPVWPEGGEDWDDHDGHRAGRAGYLQVGATEDRRDGTGDDRRDESGFGAKAGAHPEGESERQRDERDCCTGGEIAESSLPGGDPVRRARQQVEHSLPDLFG